MILSEKQFAVQGILKTGEIHFYDDLICALRHGHKDDEVTHYVLPYGSDKWILARDAKYASGLRSPMGSGFGAVSENGTVNFGEIKSKLKE